MGECLRFLEAASGSTAAGASGSSPSSGSSAAEAGGGDGAGLTALPFSFNSLAASKANALQQQNVLLLSMAVQLR